MVKETSLLNSISSQVCLDHNISLKSFSWISIMEPLLKCALQKNLKGAGHWITTIKWVNYDPNMALDTMFNFISGKKINWLRRWIFMFIIFPKWFNKTKWRAHLIAIIFQYILLIIYLRTFFYQNAYLSKFYSPYSILAWTCIFILYTF